MQKKNNLLLALKCLIVAMSKSDLSYLTLTECIIKLTWTLIKFYRPRSSSFPILIISYHIFFSLFITLIEISKQNFKNLFITLSKFMLWLWSQQSEMEKPLKLVEFESPVWILFQRWNEVASLIFYTAEGSTIPPDQYGELWILRFQATR